MQSKMSANNAEVLEQIRKFNSKFDILQSDPLRLVSTEGDRTHRFVLSL